MSNRAIELHDSELTTATWSGRDLVLRLVVYLHDSAGRPGRDGGTGWRQDGELRIESATLLVAPSEPLRILDGAVEVGSQVFDNLLPIPFDHQGATVVRLSGADGTLDVAGASATLTLLGQPTFVEDVPPLESN